MEKIRVQDDLYMYVNKEWIDQAVIPDDKPMVGGFDDLSEKVEKILIKDFNEFSKNKEDIDVNLEKAVKLFNIVKNVKKRNANGIKPILKTLAKIEKLTSVSQLNKNLAEFIIKDLPLPFSYMVEADMKNTNRHIIMLAGPSIILPDTTYYKEEMAQQKAALLGVWSSMVKKLLSFTNLSEEDQTKYIEDALAFDAIIATLVKSQEEWSEYTKMYNPMKLSRVSNMLKPLKFKGMLKKFYGEKLPEEIIIADPRFLKGFKTLFNEKTFELYKHWAYIQTYLKATSLLSEEIREIGATYRKMLSGVTSIPSVEKFAYQLTSSIFSEPIGLYYGRKYFGEEAKKDVVEIVKEIISTYKERISKNDILSEQTKEKAILKLSKIEIKMGFPDKVDEVYDKLVFNEKDNLYTIVAGLNAIMKQHNIDKLYKPTNREQWVMPGHMVNACYNPSTNDITFPAAILQPPFYSINQSRSENLGGIGAVIGHEISHAFDTNGAKCDENGNLKDWWTKEDFKKFSKKTKAMAKQFDGIELEWGKVNGSFVVSENIADNGGVAVTLNIMKNTKDADYAAYFYNWARVWCMKARPEILKLLLSIDVHSPNVLRANMQPRNFEEWYKTFNVKKTDKMYIAPNKRIIIW